MKVELAPGKYVLAVSGGVDSVVLLELLRKLPGVGLTVAHFDHGIRPDSAIDRWFVQQLAREYDLAFVFDEGRLGPDASEAAARKARYDFLRRVQRQVGAHAIVTAHHQDDVLETAIINLLRGTGRKGLSSLQDTTELRRPLLHVSKKEIFAYAQAHELQWHEDATNTDTTYLRNHIRHKILPRFTAGGRAAFLAILAQAQDTNREIDELLRAWSDREQLARKAFIALPHNVSCEVMAAWLRVHGAAGFDQKGIERLVVAAKIAVPGKRIDVDKQYIMNIGPNMLALMLRDR